jgi:hypothetical protein
MTGSLDWSAGEDNDFSHHSHAIVAWFGDRDYYIWPEHADDADHRCRITAGSSEGEQMPFGSVEVEGEPGKLTLEDAQAVARRSGHRLSTRSSTRWLQPVSKED